MAQRTLQLSYRHFWRLLRPVIAHKCPFKCSRFYSNRIFQNRILSLSSILLQDGLDVTELPIFIRKLDLSKFPYENEKCVTQVKPMTTEEEFFQEKLEQCNNLKEVFKLLEVPSDVITGYTAAFALQKICHFQRNDTVSEAVDSFIQTAVMNELYEMVKKEVTTLSNDTLFCLMRCVLTSDYNIMGSTQFLFEEIEKRISNSKFSIAELCELSCIASFHSQQTLIETCWVHIGNRYDEIDASNIHLVFRCIPTSKKPLMKLIRKQFFLCWWKLKGSDVASIVLDMLRLKMNDIKILQCIGKWTRMNIHALNDAHLTQIIAGFLHFHYTESSIIKSLERYIPAKIAKIDYNLLALAMEYCRAQRYLSPLLFDIVAEDFIKNGQNYSCLQLYSILRPYGQLNYLPTESTKFFLKTEEVLQSKISDFTLPNIVELLCSFAFLQRYPLNFSHFILTPSFLSKIKSITSEKVQTMVGEWLEMLQSAFLLETKCHNIPLRFKLPYQIKCMPTTVLHRKVLKNLNHIIGLEKIETTKLAVKSIYTIDFEISLDSEQLPLSVGASHQNVHSRLAVILHQPEHYCVNTNILLGEQTMKVRHLKLLGYKVIKVHYAMLQYSKFRQLKYLHTLLQPYINRDVFSHLETQPSQENTSS
ncbi:FAST kinase domain-containing protein 3, mitochondrial [Octopus bimaculoides]|uniref:RAP domain-containing protein n=1 Tax=Octopus bimaculoides TaxID=37653 RepID=A0A0L8HXZ4_OCTBM|nr:FAST kinase domain-containing protein 3, mitochondrial [Octopus bimaculoides]|eukprot:XP_014768739.1 PREDICTED: FAST kinase domain-containing protein 3-like [Octopus bimaculoides]